MLVIGRDYIEWILKQKFGALLSIILYLNWQIFEADVFGFTIGD